jgi:hypothetical protein
LTYKSHLEPGKSSILDPDPRHLIIDSRQINESKAHFLPFGNGNSSAVSGVISIPQAQTYQPSLFPSQFPVLRPVSDEPAPAPFGNDKPLEKNRQKLITENPGDVKGAPRGPVRYQFSLLATGWHRSQLAPCTSMHIERSRVSCCSNSGDLLFACSALQNRGQDGEPQGQEGTFRSASMGC